MRSLTSADDDYSSFKEKMSPMCLLDTHSQLKGQQLKITPENQAHQIPESSGLMERPPDAIYNTFLVYIRIE